MLRYFLIGSLLLFASIATAGDPWLLVAPDISFDDKRACFIGEKYAAYYIAEAGVVITIPKDSLCLPAPILPSNFIFYEGILYGCEGAVLNIIPHSGQRGSRSLSPPNSQALDALAKAAQITAEKIKSPQEIMGPVAAYKNFLWYGLSLEERGLKGNAAGLGWYDISKGQFGRFYNDALANFIPQWIGVSNDSVRALYIQKNPRGEITDSKLISFSIRSGAMIQLDPLALGVPGKVIINTNLWGDSLLISTDEAVAIWKSHGFLHAWSTIAYSAYTRDQNPTWLYLRTFSNENSNYIDTVKFQALPPRRPTQVRAKIGKWMQVVAPEGIEGYVDKASWEKNKQMWSASNWNCGKQPCFARVQVPMDGKIVDTDFTNTQLTFISEDQNGVKIGFVAAWAYENDLYPAYVPVKPPERTRNLRAASGSKN